MSPFRVSMIRYVGLMQVEVPRFMSIRRVIPQPALNKIYIRVSKLQMWRTWLSPVV